MIVLKWIVGIIVGLAIISNMIEWKEGEEDYERLFALIVMVLVEVIIIKG